MIICCLQSPYALYALIKLYARKTYVILFKTYVILSTVLSHPTPHSFPLSLVSPHSSLLSTLFCNTPLLTPFQFVLSHSTPLSFPLYLVLPQTSLLSTLSSLIPLLSPFHTNLYYPSSLPFPLST